MTTPPLVGLDYGRKRIGVAVSTVIGTVHPRPRIDRTAPADDLAAIRAVVEDVQAAAIVLGLPHHMDGAESDMEREVRAFAREVATACGVPVYGTDERLTSQVADQALQQQTRDPRARKSRVDSAAACILLTDFLAREDEGEKIA